MTRAAWTGVPPGLLIARMIPLAFSDSKADPRLSMMFCDECSSSPITPSIEIRAVCGSRMSESGS